MTGPPWPTAGRTSSSRWFASQENQQGAAPPPSEAGRNPDLDFVPRDLAQSAHLKESSELAGPSRRS
jgi:hypothetical protein